MKLEHESFCRRKGIGRDQRGKTEIWSVCPIARVCFVGGVQQFRYDGIGLSGKSTSTRAYYPKPDTIT